MSGQASRAEDTVRTPGVTLGVLAAAVCFSLSAGAGAGSGNLHQDPPTVLLLIGWPAFALAGGMVLDRRPGSTPGSAADRAAPWSRSSRSSGPPSPQPGSPRRPSSSTPLRPSPASQAFAVGIGIPWAVRGSLPAPAGPDGCRLAGLGALTVLLGVRDVGWVIVAAGIALTYVVIGVAVTRESRESRRRTTWLLLVLVASGAAIWLAQALDLGVADLITCGALWLVALATARLIFTTQFRPLDEHALDLAIVLVTLAAGVSSAPSCSSPRRSRTSPPRAPRPRSVGWRPWR